MLRVKLFLKIVFATLIEAFVICAATRAFVLGSYSLVALTEVAFITQWFYARNISFDDPESRSWKYGYPAYVIGSVLGAMIGLFISKSVLGL